jgi:SAM-dependent methyltransferase
MHSAQAKWDRIYREKVSVMPQAADVLSQNLHLLPDFGVALDLACGLGGNSLLLAKAGLNVKSWDISPVAIERLKSIAKAEALMIDAEVKDAEMPVFTTSTFDVIVVSHFLMRDLSSAIEAALKPGGVLFYQTYCRDKREQIGPKNPDFLLAENELLSMFPSLTVRVYREESCLGNERQGWRNQAMLVAQKPKV